jgi:organic hydroperoxide reductase OsmC/OhrA
LRIAARAEVAVCLGSDSNVQIDLLEEAGSLEYDLRRKRLERAILAMERTAVRDVCAGGEFVIRGGRYALEEDIVQEFAAIKGRSVELRNMTNSSRFHRYQVQTIWTGNTGEGTASYRAYKRDHEIAGAGKMTRIPGSSDPAFRGDAARYNPEELLIAALSTCHMLWVLHLCADAGIVITEYSDEPDGVMTENPDGSGHFTEVTLHPRMQITDAARTEEAKALHQRAHQFCAIAHSVNFPVLCVPSVLVADKRSPHSSQ